MSRLSLSSLVVLSLTSLTFTSVADARRIPTPTPGGAPAGTFAQPPPAVAAVEANVGPAIAPVDDRAPIAPSRADVRAALIKMRAQNLAHFRSYYLAGIYPSNTHSRKTANIWRDQDDHFCAAATIMVKSGNAALAIKLAETNNFVKLGDVKQGPVMDWIISSGFTQDELALIQRPFRPVADIKRPVAPENPSVDIPINAQLRKAETARLLALYKKIDKQLAAKQKQSIERATDRLMKNPALAAQIVDMFPT